MVLDSGILGCDQSGTINQWLDFSTRQVEELPTGHWVAGNRLYMAGISGGMWDLELNQFEEPRQRILVQIVDGSARVRDKTVLWSTSETVHILNTNSRSIKQIPSSPLLGQAPDMYQDSVVWVEWGESPSVVFSHLQSGKQIRIPSDYPTQLVCSSHRCAWLTNRGVHFLL